MPCTSTAAGKDLTASGQKLLYLFGLLIAFQWMVFSVMVVVEMSQTTPPSLSGGVRNLRMMEDTSFAEMNRTLTSTCFSPACLEQIALSLSRVYPNRTDQSFCVASGRKKSPQDRWQGLILVKVPKAASSTAASVSIRISRNSEQRGGEKPCKSLQWRHKPGRTYADRSRSKSFLWTTVRDPAERAISTIFYHNVSRRRPTQQQNVPDEDIIEQLRWSTHEHTGEIPPYNFWNASRPSRVRHPTALQNLVRDTLGQYDFVAVTDRMDESLVAMALLMGVPVSDVVVSSSKVAGRQYQFVHLPGNEFKCILTVSSYIQPGVKKFLESDKWKAPNWGDYLLHKAASLSLDRTIEAIGRERFDMALLEYRRLREMEQVYCAPHVKFPCSDEGIPQPDVSKESCYLPFFDFGCGYKCIDDIVKQETIDRTTSWAK
eukprot:scaffold3608_cov183-Amphora_coffeaeformis.AAC.4